MPTIVAEIKTEHQGLFDDVCSAHDRMIRIGRLLIEARAQLPPTKGAWGRWIEANVPFGMRQARKYIRLVNLRPRMEESGIPTAALNLDELIGVLALSVEVEDEEDDLEGSGDPAGPPPEYAPEDFVADADTPEDAAAEDGAPLPEPPPEDDVDDNQADLFAKDLYRHLRRNPWLWQTVDPEELACEVTDPEALHDLVKQIYEPMRHLLNALTKRLKESGKVKDTPQPLPVPGRKWTS